MMMARVRSSQLFPMRLPINHRNYRSIIGILAFALFHAGCFRLAVFDATQSPVFASVIGTEYELRTALWAVGSRPETQVDPDYILLMPQPTGPRRYNVDLGSVPAGTRFRIVGVSMLTPMINPSIQYVIAFSNYSNPRFGMLPVKIYNGKVFGLYLKVEQPNAAPGLNERYFRLVGGAQK
jgi:hypothetical protein